MGVILPEWFYTAWFAFSAVATGVFFNYLRKTPFNLKSLRWQMGLGLFITSGASALRGATIWLFLLVKRSDIIDIPNVLYLTQLGVAFATALSTVGWFVVIRAMSHDECGERGWALAVAIATFLAAVAIAL